MNKDNGSRVEVENGRLHYEVEGEGKTVVLLHAGIVDSGMWDAQWRTLTHHCRTIRYDMAGFGQSDALHGPPAHRRDLHRLLQHLGVEGVSLVGCSLGGEVALDFAIEHPELIQSLVLVSAVPTGYPLEGEPPPFVLDMIQAIQAGDMERASELQVRISVDGPFRTPEQVDPAVRQHVAAMIERAVAGGGWPLSQEMPDLLPGGAVGRLAEVRAPVLLMAGSLDHPAILTVMDVMAEAIGGSQKTIIPGAAHLPNMEKPADFNGALLDFLRKRVG